MPRLTLTEETCGTTAPDGDEAPSTPKRNRLAGFVYKTYKELIEEKVQNIGLENYFAIDESSSKIRQGLGKFIRWSLKVDKNINNITGNCWEGDVFTDVEMCKKLVPHIKLPPIIHIGRWDFEPHIEFNYKGEKFYFIAVFIRTPETENSRHYLIFKQGANMEIAHELLDMLSKVTLDNNTKTVDVQRGIDYTVSMDVLGWDEIFIETWQKKTIQNAVANFIGRKQWYVDNKIPWRLGVLLGGPPGCGKSSIIKKLCTTPGLSILSGDLGHPNFTNGDISDLYSRAANKTPSMVVLEDLDRVFKPNGATTHLTLDHLLNIMDGIGTQSAGVITVITANDPTKLDPAITRRPGRIGLVLNIKPPDFKMRVAHLSHLFKRVGLAPAFIEAVAKQTEGFSGAALTEVYAVASYNAFGDDRPTPTEGDVKTAVETLKAFLTTGSRNVGF